MANAQGNRTESPSQSRDGAEAIKKDATIRIK